MRTAVDNLYLYDPQFEPGAERFISDVGGSTETHPVRSSADIPTCIDNYTNVKFLVFDTHGEPGRLWLPDESTFEGIDFMFANKNPNFLQANARILFFGCNLAEGTKGEQFLDEVGKYLLHGRGGIVGATTVTNVSYQIGSFSTQAYMQPLSFGRLRVKRYSPAGVVLGSKTVDRHGFNRKY